MDQDFLTPQDKINQQKFDTFKRELYRRSMDSIRVYNPTDRDFIVSWDGYNHVIPAKTKDLGWGQGMRVTYRYIAEYYRRHMTNQMINEMADAELSNLKTKLYEKGDTDAVYNANDRFERQHKFRTDNAELVKKIWGQIWLGTVEKFGMDQIIDEPTQEDTKSDLEKLASEFDDIVYQDPKLQASVPQEETAEPKPVDRRSVIQDVAQ